jgi:hypothetical protein
VSITVGAGSYFAGAWYGINSMILGLVLLMAGYLGARVLTVATDRFLDFVGRQEVSGK